MESDDKSMRGMRRRNIMKIGAVVLVGVLLIGIIGWFIFHSSEEEGADVPEFDLGEEWWFSHRVEGQGSNNAYLMTKVIGTEMMEGEEFYLIGETVWNNATQEDYREIFCLMTNLSVYDSDGNLLSEPLNFPLKDGKTWKGRMDGVDNYNFTCESFSKYKVNAGTFGGFKITATGDSGNYILWYSPKVEYLIAVSYTSPGGGGEDDYSYELKLEGYGNADKDGDGITDIGEGILHSDSDNKDTDGDGVIDGSDLNPLMDLRFTLELVHLKIEDKTDLLSDPDVYIWVQIVAGDEFFSDTTETYRNQREIDLNIVYDLDIPDDGNPGPMDVGGVVNFWEQKEPAALGVALDVCGDKTDVDGFHFYFTYDIFTEVWSLYPRNPSGGSEAYLTGSGSATVSGMDDGFSLVEERPVQDATLEFDMY